MAKAGRPKKGSAGLPEWFDVEKYRAALNFKTIDWFEQLAPRAGLFSFADHLKQHGENIRDGLAEALALIKENPVITRSRMEAAPLKTVSMNGQNVEVIDPSITAMRMSMDRRLIGVSDIDLNHTSRLVMSLKEEWQLALAAQLSWRFIKPEEMPPLYREINILIPWKDDFFPTLFDTWEAPLAAIDLALPDEILMKDFAAYLKEKRKRRGNIDSPFFKSPDFTDWYKSGVLPYLDLTLWELATGESIRWNAFAEALNEIVDDPIGGEGALMKTTKAHAKKLIDARTIKILKSQAMREEQGADAESGKLTVR